MEEFSDMRTKSIIWNFNGPTDATIPQGRRIAHNLRSAGVQNVEESDLELVATTVQTGFCEGIKIVKIAVRGGTKKQIDIHLATSTYMDRVYEGNDRWNSSDRKKIVHVLAKTDDSDICMCSFLWLVARTMTEGGTIAVAGIDSITISGGRAPRKLTFKQFVKTKSNFVVAKTVYATLNRRGKMLISFLGTKSGISKMAWEWHETEEVVGLNYVLLLEGANKNAHCFHVPGVEDLNREQAPTVEEDFPPATPRSGTRNGFLKENLDL